MTISHLNRTIGTIAESKGYRLYSHAEFFSPSMIASLPAALLATPEFRSIEGRKSGKITYRLTLCLLAKGARLAPAARTALFEKLENDALAIMQRLSAAERVLAVEGLTITPKTQPLSSLGDVAMEVEGDVVVEF